MEQYTVTGMSCAACSARVEKAVSKVSGVSSCSVSLLTNSMGVEGTASPAEIIAAVEAAGYGASKKGAADFYYVNVVQSSSGKRKQLYKSACALSLNLTKWLLFIKGFYDLYMLNNVQHITSANIFLIPQSASR